MTSEISLMNQRAVALAADSAVTLIGGGNVIVRNEQRKLYELSHRNPIGLMFFGVAEIMGHPWDALIEYFQKNADNSSRPHVQDYACGFAGMLDNLVEFFPRDRQKDEYRRLLASVFRYIYEYAQFLRANGGPQRKDRSDLEILKEAIGYVWHAYQHVDDKTPRRDLACFPKGFGETVARDYADVIDEMIAYGFGNIKPDRQTTQRLRDISVFCVIKELFLEDVTGLVTAGFGAQDRYPVTVTTLVSAVIGGIAKRMEASVDPIDAEEHSKICLYADSEVTSAFIRGVEYGLERYIDGAIRMMLRSVVDHVVDSFTNVDAAQRENVRRQFQTQHVPRYFEAFQGMVGRYQQETYINPILRVIEMAPRQELAEIAHDMVALNVFKKRIMAEQPTVGGAIDVAVITREGGFQWSKKQGG